MAGPAMEDYLQFTLCGLALSYSNMDTMKSCSVRDEMRMRFKSDSKIRFPRVTEFLSNHDLDQCDIGNPNQLVTACMGLRRLSKWRCYPIGTREFIRSEKYFQLVCQIDFSPRLRSHTPVGPGKGSMAV